MFFGFTGELKKEIEFKEETINRLLRKVKKITQEFRQEKRELKREVLALTAELKKSNSKLSSLHEQVNGHCANHHFISLNAFYFIT